MKISLNWLKKYLDFDLEINTLADLLTQIGLEVEGLDQYESIPGGLEGLIVGKVVECEKHPNADKLSLTKVDTGTGELLQIVCGAPNVAQGQHVVVAPVGVTLHPVEGDTFPIKRTRIRGVESLGMICAEDEIGIGHNHDGIITLPTDIAIGSKVSAYYDIQHDYIIDIGLTANRSDAYSHIGVARDLKAALNIRNENKLALELPNLNDFSVEDNNFQIEVEVKNHEACPRYSGVTICGVKTGPSPEWMQHHLNAIGVRPINVIVDITNYVLHEYGQPLHAFDADKIIGNKVVVKTGMGGTVFKSLDEVDRTLHDDDLIICNAEAGMCIAGVFGGIDSGVSDDTANIFLESAYFDPVFVRRTSTRHALKTDAASHFEKGTDPNLTIPALKRAAILMRDLAGGTISSDIVDVYPEPVKDFEVSITYDNVNRLTGKVLDKHTVQMILAELGITIDVSRENGLDLIVPSFKTDVKREADIIEEILRIYGLDNIPLPEFLRTNISSNSQSHTERIRNYISDYLCGMRFYEMFTNSISQSSYIKKHLPDSEDAIVYLANSLNAHLDILRPTTVFSGLESIRYNINRKNKDLRLFELGKVFWKEEEKYLEREVLSMFITGNMQEENWHHDVRPTTFFDLKEVIHKTLSKLGINDFQSKFTEDTLLQFGMSYHQGNTSIVKFGKVKGKICKEFDINQDVFFAEIDWQNALKVRSRREINYQPLQRFPSMRRDLSIVIDQEISFAKVEKIAVQTAKKLLDNLILFDVFEGESLGDGKKAYAIGLVFQHPEKTLKDKEVDKIMKQLMFRYEKEMDALIRR